MDRMTELHPIFSAIVRGSLDELEDQIDSNTCSLFDPVFGTPLALLCILECLKYNFRDDGFVVDAMERLIICGCDPFVVSVCDYDCFMLAASFGNSRLAILILMYGALTPDDERVYLDFAFERIAFSTETEQTEIDILFQDLKVYCRELMESIQQRDIAYKQILTKEFLDQLDRLVRLARLDHQNVCKLSNAAEKSKKRMSLAQMHRWESKKVKRLSERNKFF